MLLGVKRRVNKGFLGEIINAPTVLKESKKVEYKGKRYFESLNICNK